MLLHRFLPRTEFDSYEDFKANYKVNIPEDFNFGFDVVDAWAEADKNKKALVWCNDHGEEKTFTFSDISRLSNKTANYFRSLGIKKGDVVMMILRRRWEYWICATALHKVGAVLIPGSLQLTKKDIVYRGNSAEVKAIICVNDDFVINQVEASEKEIPTLENKIVVGEPRDGWRFFEDEIEPFSDKFARPTGDQATNWNDIMLVYFTSGTTGMPKMVQHNFAHPLGHIVTAKYWQMVQENKLHMSVSDSGWAKFGWGKIYGQWLCEACIFTYDFDNFDAKEILHMIEKYKITTFCAPPTVYRVMVHLKLDQYDLSSLQNVTTAGEALNPEIFEKFKAKTGLTLMEGFGQTETTLTIGNLVGTTPKPGSMGVPTPQYDVQIMLPDGTLAGPEEEGEIVICTEDGAPNGLFMEYYGDEEKTQNAWHDGYYHTGDTAYFDEDGYLWYVGRTDDVIKSSGYRIGPFEIENEIMKLPYVLECAVTSVPDPIRGQAIKASIVLANGEEGTDKLRNEIMKSLKKNIASYKWPKILDFTKELPKTISGKIRRKEIKENDWNENEDNE